jgi:hypothetical protein
MIFDALLACISALGNSILMLLAIVPDEDLVSTKSVTIPAMFTVQAADTNTPNFIHQSRIDSRVPIIPRSARMS